MSLGLINDTDVEQEFGSNFFLILL